MRETIFRAKEKGTNIWRYGYYIEARVCDYDKKGKVTLVDESWIEDGFGLRWIVDKETLGQFTGISDKNSNKIFEDDILHIKSYIGITVDYGIYEITGQVFFSNGNYCVKSKMNPLSWKKTCDMDIIGNIFDNPEILERND